MLATKKREKKSRHFECMLSLAIRFGVMCFFVLAYVALKTWTIILTIGQHCHFLIFGFEMKAQEEIGEEDPCMKILLKEMKSWEMTLPF
jgi:hypothetical protein